MIIPYIYNGETINLVPESELLQAKNIIADLLANPYPHDLIAIRLKASKYASETSAMADMETYCTNEFMLKARADWNATQETAREWLKKGTL